LNATIQYKGRSFQVDNVREAYHIGWALAHTYSCEVSVIPEQDSLFAKHFRPAGGTVLVKIDDGSWGVEGP
jgi:hypothetical protein